MKIDPKATVNTQADKIADLEGKLNESDSSSVPEAYKTIKKSALISGELANSHFTTEYFKSLR